MARSDILGEEAFVLGDLELVLRSRDPILVLRLLYNLVHIQSREIRVADPLDPPPGICAALARGSNRIRLVGDLLDADLLQEVLEDRVLVCVGTELVRVELYLPRKV